MGFVFAIALLLVQTVNPAPPTETPIATVTDSPAIPNTSQTGTVKFRERPCTTAVKNSITSGFVVYRLWDSSKLPTIAKVNRWNGETTLTWSTAIPAGVYSYAVSLIDKTHGAGICESTFHVAVLPGSVRTIDEEMFSGSEDPIPQIFVYGLLPKGARASVVRFVNNVACGSSAQAETVAVKTERDRVGYYADEGLVSSFQQLAAKELVLGVRIKESGLPGSRTLRLLTHYPEGIINVPPIAVRFDITQATIQKAWSHPANTLVCT